MKKLICVILAALIVFTLAACGNSATETADKQDTATQADDKQDDASSKTAQQSSDDIDIDLTAMSSTMIYSEVQNMMTKPDDYVGMKVKMAGQFNVAEVGDNRYFACLIKDATACCASGVEFVWKGNHSYPDDYPEKDAPITVTGTFTTYQEGKATYCQLKDAELQF